MKRRQFLFSGAAVLIAVSGQGASVWAGTTIQVGASGKTFASGAVQCANPGTGAQAPFVEAGLFNSKRNASADVLLNSTLAGTVTTAIPVVNVWLAEGHNTVDVVLSKRTADRYEFTVAPDKCALPDTAGNTFSADGTLEYAASGKSYATVTPGCAMNPTTGQGQPYVHLFDNGDYLLNVSVNGIALTQLSPLHTHTPVFLSAGMNVISAANAGLSIDYYVRDGGEGRCVLP